MTKILGIGGSPRQGGNSDLMLQAVLKGAKAEGVQVEEIYLRDYQYSSCVGCERCRKDKACTKLMDGMQLIYPQLEEAKGLVLASPTHQYNVTALMKAFLDRLYQYYDFTDDHPRQYSSRLADQGRKAAFAAVCEQTDEHSFGFTLEGMQRPMQPLGYENVGSVVAYELFHRGKVKNCPDILEQAEELGRKLALSLNE